ncbi:MAG: RAMP superfamily CRISPR-associated protein [Synergistaceae bacterium]
MKTEIFQGTIKALSPIHHGGPEQYGTVKTILTIPFLTDAEEIVEIPVIHGNAIRGYLRRLIMQDFLENIEYQLDNPKLYHALFSGGLLEAKAKSTGQIDAKLKREIRAHIPPLSLLGTAIGNQMIQGKLKVDLAVPIVEETKEEGVSAYEIRSRDFGTRLDDLREYREEDEQATQMKYEFEVIVPGTRFFHEFILLDASEIERACFIRALNLWNQRPYLGGKSGAGYGKIQIEYDNWVPEDERPYLDYLGTEREELSAYLDELGLML